MLMLCKIVRVDRAGPAARKAIAEAHLVFARVPVAGEYFTWLEFEYSVAAVRHLPWPPTSGTPHVVAHLVVHELQ
jgi:hypothetical protein